MLGKKTIQKRKTTLFMSEFQVLKILKNMDIGKTIVIIKTTIFQCVWQMQ